MGRGMRTGTQEGGRGPGLLIPASPTVTRACDLSSHRACLGQCFSYSVPNTFPQSTESLVHCDSCMPAQSMWEIVSTGCLPHPVSAWSLSWPWPFSPGSCIPADDHRDLARPHCVQGEGLVLGIQLWVSPQDGSEV